MALILIFGPNSVSFEVVYEAFCNLILVMRNDKFHFYGYKRLIHVKCC